MDTTVIIPTYNERENISKIVLAISSLLPQVNILVVDDNSPDKTYEVVCEMQKNIPNLFLLLRQKKEGLGKAYMDAFQTVLKEYKSKIIIMMDADFSHDPKYLPSLLKAAESYDVVIGSRYIKDGGVQGWNFRRRFLSKFANIYVRSILGIPVFDCTSGFILLKTDILRRVDFNKIGATGYAFLIELKNLLWKIGARFKEIPIVFCDRTVGESKISSKIIREGVFVPWKIKLGFLKNIKIYKKYFFDINFKEINNKLIFLDIDGTVVRDGDHSLDQKTLDGLKTLGINNKIFFCSNSYKNGCNRHQNIVSATSILCLDSIYKKPNKKILKLVENENNLPLLVIGDKFLTDGLFAKNINADFLKIKRIVSSTDRWYIKLFYLFDDIIFFLVRYICHI